MDGTATCLPLKGHKNNFCNFIFERSLCTVVTRSPSKKPPGGDISATPGSPTLVLPDEAVGTEGTGSPSATVVTQGRTQLIDLPPNVEATGACVTQGPP